MHRGVVLYIIMTVLNIIDKKVTAYFYAISLSQCSVSCGGGVRTRELRCAERDSNEGFTEFPIRRCRNLRKPHMDLQQGCNKGQCPDPQPHVPEPGQSSAMVLSWYSSPWQQVQKYILFSGGIYLPVFYLTIFFYIIVRPHHIVITAIIVIAVTNIAKNVARYNVAVKP